MPTNNRPVSIFEDIDAKLKAIMDVLKPKAQPAPVEEWEDVTAVFSPGDLMFAPWKGKGGENHHIRKIDGMHNGPAFIIERRKV